MSVECFLSFAYIYICIYIYYIICFWRFKFAYFWEDLQKNIFNLQLCASILGALCASILVPLCASILGAQLENTHHPNVGWNWFRHFVDYWEGAPIQTLVDNLVPLLLLLLNQSLDGVHLPTSLQFLLNQFQPTFGWGVFSNCAPKIGSA